MILIASMCLITACATPVNAGKKSVNTHHDTGVTFAPIAHARTVELLNFTAHYSELPAEKQKALYHETIQNLANDKNDIKFHIQRCAMLSLPNSTMKDPALAQTLLHSLIESNQLNDSDASLVKLLLSYTEEHNKLIASTIEHSRKNELLKQKNKSLAQKLNDLKNIEKTMIERKTNNKL